MTLQMSEKSFMVLLAVILERNGRSLVIQDHEILDLNIQQTIEVHHLNGKTTISLRPAKMN